MGRIVHVPAVEELDDWWVHRNIMEGVRVSQAAKTILGQRVLFLRERLRDDNRKIA